jgi:hypothetical protein
MLVGCTPILVQPTDITRTHAKCRCGASPEDEQVARNMLQEIKDCTVLYAHLVGLVTENKLVKMHRVSSFKIVVIYWQRHVNYGPVCIFKVLMPFMCEVQHNAIAAALTHDTHKPEREQFGNGSS